MNVIRDLKAFYFDFHWPKDIDDNLKHEIEFVIESNESLAEKKIKNEIEQFLSNISMETMFMNTENSKTNEPHKFAVNFSQRLDIHKEKFKKIV